MKIRIKIIKHKRKNKRTNWIDFQTVKAVRKLTWLITKAKEITKNLRDKIEERSEIINIEE